VEALANTAVIIGVASVGLLWAFSLLGAAATVWETMAGHVDALANRIKG